MTYRGIFREKKEADPYVQEVDFYRGLMAQIVNAYNASISNFEFRIFVEYYNKSKGQLLEIGCGSGRVTIPLAKHGVSVLGIDNSEDMLRLLDSNIEHDAEKDNLRRLIRTKQADVYTYDFLDNYNIVIIPATTISLLALEYDRMVATLQRIYQGLASGGFLIFDYAIILKPEESVLDDIIRIENGEYHCLHCNYIDYVDRTLLYNVFVENTFTQERYISYSLKKILSTSEIYKLIYRLGFRIVDELDLKLSEALYQRFVILKK